MSITPLEPLNNAERVKQRWEAQTDNFDSALRRRLDLIRGFGAESNRSALNALANKKYQVTPLNDTTGSGFASAGTGAEPGSLRDRIVQNAASRKGVPYVWGGESMAEGGFDCSGLVYDAYSRAGIKVSRKTAAGYSTSMGKIAPVSTLKPGDLVAWGKSPASATHIAVYAGNGMMWEAPRRGKPVQYVPVRGGGFGISVSMLG